MICFANKNWLAHCPHVLMVQVEDVSNWSARMRQPMEAVYGVEGFPKLWFWTENIQKKYETNLRKFENIQRKSYQPLVSIKLSIEGQTGAKLTSRFGRTGVTFAAMRLTFLLNISIERLTISPKYLHLGGQNYLSYSCDPWSEGCHGGRGACPLLAWGLENKSSFMFFKPKFSWSPIFRRSLSPTSSFLRMANTTFI